MEDGTPGGGEGFGGGGVVYGLDDGVEIGVGMGGEIVLIGLEDDLTGLLFGEFIDAGGDGGEGDGTEVVFVC